MRLRSYLLLVVTVALASVLSLSSLLVLKDWHDQRQAINEGALDTVRALSLAVDLAVQRAITGLRVMAASEHLTTNRLEAFYDDLARVSTQSWDTVLLARPDGRQLLNLRRPFGALLPNVANQQLLDAVMKSREPVVSDLVVGRVTGRPLVIVAVPVVRDDVVRYVLMAGIFPETFERLLRGQHLAPGWIVSLVDRNARFIASSRGPSVIGRPASATLTEMTREYGEAAYRSVTVEGIPSYSALERSTLSGWTVAIAVPATLAEAPLRRSLRQLGGLVLFVTAATAAITLMVARRLSRGIHRLTVAAATMEHGGTPDTRASGVQEVDEVSNALAAASGALRAVYRQEQTARAKAEAAEGRLLLLGELARSITDALDPDTVLWRLVRAACDLCGSDSAAIFLRDGDSPGVVPRYRVGPWPDAYNTLRVEPGQGMGGQAIVTRRPVRTAVYAGDARVPASFHRIADEIGAVALMVVPILIEKEVEGLLYVSNHSPRDFTDEDERVCMQLADQAAIAINNARLFAREQAARSEAEAASRAKDEFLAVLSHELRTPLTTMIGWLRLLRSGRLDADQTVQALDVIDRSTRLQAKLIADLLDVSRIVSGKFRLELRAVDLARIIGEAVDAVRRDAQAKGLGLDVTLAADVGPVRGDPMRLHQVVTNLLSNAMKFTPCGGRIDVRLERAGSHARIVVRDTGRGIDAATLPYVFEPFRQADGTTTREHGGLGLGLAIVRRLVALHDGRVRAESEGLGRGATFVVELPLGAVEPAGHDVAAPADPADVPTRLDGLRVLVVDDDGDARAMIAEVLRQAGARVETARSVAEALDCFARARIEVLVTDIAMPGADGYALLAAWRSMEDPRHPTPAIALTAHAGREDRERVLGAGFQQHLPKPIDPETLVAAVAAVLPRSSIAAA